MSIALVPGEIHALCGENGAGKSTLIRCLSGALRPDHGSVLLDGQPLRHGVRGAESSGIAVIHQDPTVFPDLPAPDTVFAGREPSRLAGLWLDRRSMRRHTRYLLDSLDAHVDLDRPVGELSLAQRQLVAIARALALRCRVLILDEPTASLSSHESDTLLTRVRALADSGVAILYVSHRLEEVLAVSARVSVLRDGRLISTRPAQGLSRNELVRLMVGRDGAELPPTTGTGLGPEMLQVRNLSLRGSFAGISLSARAREIVGLGGLIGAGRSELVRCIAGIDTPDTGEVHVGTRRLRPGHSADALDAGLALVPEDRRAEGLVTAMSIGDNIAMAGASEFADAGIIRHERVRTAGRTWISRLNIRARSTESPAGSLSGGNQQKVLLAKWLSRSPRVLILDEPTRGVDVGAKSEIHALIRTLATDGAAVLLISSDLPELLALSDRVLVMHAGRLAGELDRAHATPDTVLSLAVPPDRPRMDRAL